MVVLIPKKEHSIKIEDFRPITLLNSDFKILTRLINNRMKPLLGKILGPYQTAAGTGRSMMNILSEYRDIIYLTWLCKCQIAMMFLDFNKAFDRINHTFLLNVLRRMGFNAQFTHLIQKCIVGTHSRIKINGQLTNPVQIKQSVRQGCPLSMTLYSIAVEPLLLYLHLRLNGLKIFNTKTVCHAYADDISVLVNTKQEIETVRTIILAFTSACGAKLNEHKSKILPIGPNSDHMETSWLQKTDKIKCLGMFLTPNPYEMIKLNWEHKLNILRATLKENTTRSLNRMQRVLFINTYIISKTYHTGAVLLISPDIAHKILTAIYWYIWRGNIFKVSLQTMTLPRTEGGLGVKDVRSQCTALFINQTTKILQSDQVGITKYLFTTLAPKDQRAPVNVGHINAQLAYICKYYTELSYLQEATHRYTTSKLYSLLTRGHPQNPIELKYPGKKWKNIWKNINNNILTTDVKAVWYDIVNEKVPTGEKLYKINLKPDPLCDHCQLVDTLAHTFVCRDRNTIWKWTRKKLAIINRTSEAAISVQEILYPEWNLYPSMKHNSYSWLLGNFINYIIRNKNTTLEEFMIYIKEEHYKLQKLPKYKQQFQNFLIHTLI